MPRPFILPACLFCRSHNAVLGKLPFKPDAIFKTCVVIVLCKQIPRRVQPLVKLIRSSLEG